MRAYRAAWRKKNPGACTAWKRANRGRHLEKKRAWAKANADKLRAEGRAYRGANRDKDHAWQAAYRARHPELHRARHKAWRKANPDKDLARRHRRQARCAALPATLTVEEWAAILEHFGHRCAYCMRADVKLTQEHVVPLSRGGAYTAQNIVPACKSCNSKKGDRPIWVMLRAA